MQPPSRLLSRNWFFHMTQVLHNNVGAVCAQVALPFTVDAHNQAKPTGTSGCDARSCVLEHHNLTRLDGEPLGRFDEDVGRRLTSKAEPFGIDTADLNIEKMVQASGVQNGFAVAA